MEIFVKNVKLINKSKAIVKSKWCDESIKLNILVCNEEKEIWKIYKGECTASDIREQCNPLNIDYEQMKNYLTLETNTDGIMYDIIGNKFIVFMKEYLGSDSEGYADIIYFKLPLDCEELSMDILVEQFIDIRHVTMELKCEKEGRKKDKEETQKLADSYDKMLEQKQNFEKKFFNKAAAVFNAKKLFIQENITDKVSMLNISHDARTSDDMQLKNKKMEEKIYSSPSRTPSKRHSSTKINTTPNKRTPIKGMQRTPSKRLREIQDMSDSDDSFTVLSCDNSNKFSSKSISESLDSSRVFKNFKIKTPVKQKHETRESSVELKIDRKTDEIKASDSESEHKSTESKGSNQQNAQQMEVDVANNNNSQSLNTDTVIDDEEIPCSQEMESPHISSFSERMSLRSRNKSKKPKIDSSVNPYDVDTINILNISD